MACSANCSNNNHMLFDDSDIILVWKTQGSGTQTKTFTYATERDKAQSLFVSAQREGRNPVQTRAV